MSNQSYVPTGPVVRNALGRKRRGKLLYLEAVQPIDEARKTMFSSLRGAQIQGLKIPDPSGCLIGHFLHHPLENWRGELKMGTHTHTHTHLLTKIIP